MKRFFVALCVALAGTGMIVADAEAKRLGGGKSSGISRDNVMKRDATPAQPAAPGQSAATAPAAGQAMGAPAAAQAGGMSRWMGPLAGLAAGIGLAALFSHLGMSEAFGSLLLMLLLGVVAFFVIRMLLGRRRAPGSPLQYAGAGAGAGGPSPYLNREAPAPIGTSAAPERAAESAYIPAGFDTEGFLRQAKLNFLRLQAANDAGNLEDIREFTTPEMFAEIRLQMQERGSQPQETDVTALNADLLDVSEEKDRYLASVRFHGTIREVAGAAPEAFDEVWHLAKPRDGSTGWVIAGIQQRS